MPHTTAARIAAAPPRSPGCRTTVEAPLSSHDPLQRWRSPGRFARHPSRRSGWCSPPRPLPQERLPPKPGRLRQALHTRARPPRWCYRLHRWWRPRWCDSSGVVVAPETTRRCSPLPEPTTSPPAAASASSTPGLRAWRSYRFSRTPASRGGYNKDGKTSTTAVQSTSSKRRDMEAKASKHASKREHAVRECACASRGGEGRTSPRSLIR